MFGIGATEFIILVVIVAIFIGPEQLPKVVQSVGKLFRSVTKARTDFEDSIQQDDTFRTLSNTITQAKRTVDDKVASVRRELEAAVEPDEKVEKKSDEDSPQSKG